MPTPELGVRSRRVACYRYRPDPILSLARPVNGFVIRLAMHFTTEFN